MVETGFTRAKNAAHTMSMNFMVYPIGMLGYWICGFALQMGGVGGDRRPGRHAAAQPASSAITLFGKTFGLFGTTGLLPGLRRLRRGGLHAVPVPDGVHGHGGDDPDGRDGRALEVVLVPGLRLLHVDVRLSAVRATGSGAAAGCRSSARTSASATATSTSPVRRSCTWSAASRRWPARSSSGRGSGKYDKNGKPVAIPGHHIPMAIVGTFILAFGWFGFNPGSTLAGTDLRIGVVATNTMLASARRRDRRDDLHDVAVREAGPVDDGQRHAGGPGRDHRALRLRDRPGRGADRRDLRACWCASRSSSSRAR